MRSAATSSLKPIAVAVLLVCHTHAVHADDAALENVVVTAAGYEQNIADAPASISVITREELDKQSFTTIVDAVKNIPGVYVTGGGNMQDISIRGMSSSYTLYLVDGRPISAGRAVNTNGADGGKQIGLPPLSMIERIEIIRGPMSSLYGSDAMGGVINIITRKSSDHWNGTLGAEFTRSMNDVSNDLHSYNVFAGGPLVEGLLNLQLNGSHTGADESDFQGGGDSAASRPETKRRQGGAELIFTPNAQNRFTAGFNTAKQETTHTPGKSVASTTTGLPSTYRYDKDTYMFTHDGRYGNLMVNSYFQRDVSERDGEQTREETITTLNSQATYLWGKHVVSFGGQYKDESFIDETNGLLTSNIPGAVRELDRWIAALFTEVEWRISDALAVTTGLRYNDDELFGGHLSPRIYGIYHLNDMWTLKGGVSTGYRQPSLTQVTPGHGRGTGGGGSPAPHPRALIIGNPDLEPETSTSFEFGYVFDNASAGLNTSLMVFHTQYKDKIAEDRICESPNSDRMDPSTWVCPFGPYNYNFLSTTKNIDEAIIQGVEITLDYQLARNLKLSGSYTYTESEQKSGEFKGEPLNKMPKQMINATLDWQATPKLNTWVQANYRSKTSEFMGRTSMSDPTPGYGFVDVGVNYQLTPSARIKATIGNLTNKEVTNETYGVVLDGRRVTVGLTVDF